LLSRSALAAFAAAACVAHAEVTVSNAWVRAMVPGQKTAAGYLTLKSTEDAKVVGVSSSAAGMAMLHASTITSGVARMDALDVLKLPAGKTVELKPGCDHVMLMDVPRPFKHGDKVPLVLTIEDARGKRSKLEVTARVTPIAE
jgi:copper(I)-binding protein